MLQVPATTSFGVAKPKGMACMLCGEEPCICNAQPKKKAPRPAIQKRTDAVESSHGPAPSASPSALAQPSEDEYAMIAAVRIFQATFGKLEGPDVEQIRSYLDSPASIAERAAFWRVQRRGE